jgi:hypothetical protein
MARGMVLWLRLYSFSASALSACVMKGRFNSQDVPDTSAT